MDIKIDPKDIEQAIVDAVIRSSLGDAIKTVVEREVLTIAQSHSTMSKAIHQEIRRVVVEILREEYADTLRDAIRTKLTDAMIDDIVGSAMESFIEKIFM